MVFKVSLRVGLQVYIPLGNMRSFVKGNASQGSHSVFAVKDDEHVSQVSEWKDRLTFSISLRFLFSPSR